jgi:hypothetical protein
MQTNTETKINKMEHTQTFGKFTHTNADGRDAYNFSAGPCQLPKAVLAKAQEEMFNYKGCG